MVSPVASLQELSFIQVLQNNQENVLTPIVIRDIAGNILEQALPYLVAIQNVTAPVLFAKNSPEHLIRELSGMLKKMLPNSTSQSLASIIDQIGRGSRYTNIINESGELISFPDTDSATDERRGAFCKAISFNWEPMIFALLLSTGPYPEEHKGLALCVAASKGRTGIVSILLKDGGISEQDIGRALGDAADKGHTEVIPLLLSTGPISDRDRDRALRYAASRGHVEIVSLLLSTGPISEESRGEALRRAVEEGRTEVSLLLENGKSS